MLDRAECKHIPFHGLRHIFATNGIENGLDIKTLSAILGHSSAETTISTYSHVTGLMEKRAAEKLDQAYGNRTEADSTATPAAEPRPAKFTAKQGKRRKPGTGCISQVSKNTWQGKYTPWNPDGTRQCHVVYAKSYEECERKLEEMIANLKAGENQKWLRSKQ